MKRNQGSPSPRDDIRPHAVRPANVFPYVSLPPFEEVVAAHGAVVLRVCRALLGPHDAEDAWSETFLSALRAYPRLAPDSHVRGWLITIAQRKAIDCQRANRRRAVPSDALDAAAGSDAAPAPRDEALWRAVSRLPPKQRGAVVYHHLADLPYAEVGALLGTSEAAARRSAADGIANLRTRYAREESA